MDLMENGMKQQIQFESGVKLISHFSRTALPWSERMYCRISIGCLWPETLRMWVNFVTNLLSKWISWSFRNSSCMGIPECHDEPSKLPHVIHWPSDSGCTTVHVTPAAAEIMSVPTPQRAMIVPTPAGGKVVIVYNKMGSEMNVLNFMECRWNGDE